MKYSNKSLLCALLALAQSGLTPGIASVLIDDDSWDPHFELQRSPNQRIALHAWLPPMAASDSSPEPKQVSRTKLALYRHGGSGVEQLSRFEIEGYLPYKTLLSNDGKFIVFLQRNGRAIEIFLGDGTLVRSLELQDLFTARDRSRSRTYYTSRPSWLEDYRIDQQQAHLVLAFGSTALELRIDLESGALTEPKRDLFPYYTTEVSRSPTFELPAGQAWSLPTCLSDSPPSFEEAVSKPLSELLQRSHSTVTPIYSEIAEKAQISGRVGVEILVSHGRVECFRTSRELPMGLTWNATEAVKRWQFKPGQTGLIRSAFAFEFSIVHHNQTLPMPVLAQTKEPGQD